MIDLFNTLFYQPLYNGFIFLISITPGGDVGLAIVLLTVAVKFLILPLTHKSVSSQAKIRKIDPQVKEIKEKYSKDKQEQARKIMELYRQHGINPFTGCFLILVQLPIVVALYSVFYKGLINLNPDLLYNFISLPDDINMRFLGLFDMGGRSVVLALLAGIFQYLQIKFSLPELPKSTQDKPSSIKDEIARNMNIQMRYILPFFVVVISYSISAAVALYWTVNNIFSVVHELIVKKKADRIVYGKEVNISQ